MSLGALVQSVPNCAIKRELQSLRDAGKRSVGGQHEVHGEITRLGITRGGGRGEEEDLRGTLVRLRI